MTYDEFKALCLRHNAEYKAALEEIVTADYVTEAMKERIESFRAKDAYLSELHAHFTLERLHAEQASYQDLFAVSSTVKKSYDA